MNRLPMGVRVPLALGTLIGANAIVASPAEAHEEYANTPIGVSIEAAQRFADGDIRGLDKVLDPTYAQGMAPYYKPYEGHHNKWAEVRPSTAHIVDTWQALAPYEGTTEVEIRAAHPIAKKGGLRGFCIIVKPENSHWKVVTMGTDINTSKEDCGVPRP